jgi:hypothetical protein
MTAAIRWTGAALALGGAVNALFVIASNGQFFGAEHVLSPQWALAHQAHFWAGLLLLFGTLGVYARLREQAAGTRSRFATVAVGIALLGTALFFGGGMVTAFIWPVMAAHAPHLVEASSPMWSPQPLPIIGISIVMFALGHLLLGVAAYRSAACPRAVAALYAVGALLQGLPVQPLGPFPYAVAVAGAVSMGVGAVTMGYLLWQGWAAEGRRRAGVVATA